MHLFGGGLTRTDDAGLGEECPHLNRGAGVSCSCIEARTATSRRVMKMECAIVVRVVNVSWIICTADVSYLHSWRTGDAVMRGHYATLVVNKLRILLFY